MGEQSKMNEDEIIPIYDDIVTFFPEFRLMINQIAHSASGDVLEIGVGTGLLTKKLLDNLHISELELIEPSAKFMRKFPEKFPGLDVKQCDGLDYKGNKPYNTIVMSLVYHHVKDEDKLNFLKNMYENLSQKGRLIIGDMFIPYYASEIERDYSLRKFHDSRIKRINNTQIREIEIQALEDGLRRDGEWKTSYEILENQVKKIGFSNVSNINVGLQESGEYKVVIAHK